MAAEGHNVDATLLSIGRDHGHYFVRKTFTKTRCYCHHCCDMIFGLMRTGYACEGMMIMRIYPDYIRLIQQYFQHPHYSSEYISIGIIICC